jgi:hypothetical protein
MTTIRTFGAYTITGIALLLFGGNHALAHCDGIDGPVVKAAQKALATNNVNLVLAWVQPGDETELRSAFQQTVAVRKLSPESKALADRQLFETLVRLHRSGEGAPYTGLKPAGRDLGPAIPAADHALESGDLDVLEKLLVAEVRKSLHESFEQAQAKKKYDANDVAAGREYVKAYVEYIHFVERLHEATAKPADGHFAEGNEHK